MSSILRKAFWPAAVVLFALFMMSFALPGVASATEDSTIVLSQGDSCDSVDITATVVDNFTGHLVIHVWLDGVEQDPVDLGSGPPAHSGDGDWIVATGVGDGIHVEVSLEGNEEEIAADDLVTEVSDCPPPPATTATITVIKDTDPETDPGDEDLLNSFDLDPGPTVKLADDGSHDFVVNPGDYTITETSADGWMLNDISCTGIDKNDAIVDLDSNSVDLQDVEAGDHVTCTFNNVPVPPPEPTPVPPVIDVCANIEGAQATVPAGLQLEVLGNITVCLVPEPTPAPTQAPPVVSPPNTGDGGLLASESGGGNGSLLAIAGAVGVALAGFGTRKVIRR